MVRHRRAAIPRGFTFIELLATLAIMAVIGLMATPMAEVAVQRHKERQLRSALAEMRSAIDAYKRAAEQGRIKVNVGDSGYPKNLEVLVDGVDDQKNSERKKIYFLRRMPRDPMASDEQASPSETWSRRSYESPPDDPKEGDDIFDVFSKSERIGSNGVPYREW